MRPQIAILFCLISAGPAFGQVNLPLSERDTRTEARQLIGKMKTAYDGMTGFTAVVTRTCLGPADEVANVDSGRWKLSWSTDGKGLDRIAIEAQLAEAPLDPTSYFGGAAGPLAVIYDGKKGAIAAPDASAPPGKKAAPNQKVYPLTIDADQPHSVWTQAANAARWNTAQSSNLLSLIYGSDPIQEFPAALQELRIGKPQFLGDVLCDVVIARFISLSGRPARSTMTILLGHDDGLLRQIITTGSQDGRERLQVETVIAQQRNARFGGATFRVPVVTVKAGTPEEQKPVPVEAPTSKPSGPKVITPVEVKPGPVIVPQPVQPKVGEPSSIEPAAEPEKKRKRRVGPGKG